MSQEVSNSERRYRNRQAELAKQFLALAKRAQDKRAKVLAMRGLSSVRAGIAWDGRMSREARFAEATAVLALTLLAIVAGMDIARAFIGG